VGHGGAIVPDEAISERVARERNKLLRAEYGTTDPTEIKRIQDLRNSQLEEYKTLKAAADEANRAAMSEQERLATDLNTANAKIEELNAQISEMQTGQVVNDQTQKLQGIASEHINPKMVRYALIDFQKHVIELPPEEVKRLTPRAVERWFKKFAEDNPEFKLPPPATTTPLSGSPAVVETPAPVVKTPVRRVGMTTSTAPKGGAPSTKPKSPEPGAVAGKVIKPGQENSMSKQELNTYLRSIGRKPW
jgi:TolA-binding protein